MIPGCTVIELRADRTPGEQAQGAYARIYAEQRAAGIDAPLARMLARLAARAVSQNARRNAAEHTRQGLATERFVDQSAPRYGAWSGLDADNPPY